MFRCASFFAGVGGIDLGFEQAGFDVVYANEICEKASLTFNQNHEIELDTRDIREVPSSEIPDFDFPLEFEVKEFTVVCIGTKKTRIVCTGNGLSRDAIKEIEKLEKGQTVIFEQFVVHQVGFGEVDRPNDKFTLEIK